MAFLPLITLLLASARKSGLRRSLNAAEDSISTLEEAMALIASLKAAAARTREAEDAASAPDFQDSASSTSQRLVYRAPAQDDEWMSALPLGNGRLHKPSRLLWKDPSTLSSIAVALVADVGGVGGAACDIESIDAVSWAMNAWASKRHPAVIGTIVTLPGQNART